MTPTGARILAALSQKERETLALVCTGKTNSEIAALMGTVEQVIKNRLMVIRKKLRSRSRAQLIVSCFYHGVVQCPCGAHKESESK